MADYGALSDIRVLDLSRVLSGPYAAMWLGDLGADIIKIEMPGKGDDARMTPIHVNGASTFFAAINRNKLKGAGRKGNLTGNGKGSRCGIVKFPPGGNGKTGAWI